MSAAGTNAVSVAGTVSASGWRTFICFGGNPGPTASLLAGKSRGQIAKAPRYSTFDDINGVTLRTVTTRPGSSMFRLPIVNSGAAAVIGTPA